MSEQRQERETFDYFGPAIREGGDATVMIDGRFTQAGEQSYATGSYVVIEDERFPGEDVHRYFVPVAEFESGKGKRAS